MYKSDLVFKTPLDSNYYFGYYDKSQVNRSNTKLLAIKVAFNDHVPSSNDVAEIGYFELTNDHKKFIKIGTTRSFNWQQGCMLQWVGPDFENKVIYNDLRNEKFVSILYDISLKKENVLDRAIYSMNPNGISAVCIDFERHYWCRRGYSYDGVVDDTKNTKIVKNDGVWVLDINSNSSKQIISLDYLIKNKPISNMDNATHYVEHLMYNKSGSRFCFLHRWKIADGGIYARLYTANPDGSDIFLLNDSGRMSHFGWKNDIELLAYGGLENSINKLRKYKKIAKIIIQPLLPLYHKIVKDNSKISKLITGDSYIMLTDKSSIKQRTALEISSEDGHPSFGPNQFNFITDTYSDPKEGSTAKLIVYNLLEETHQVLDVLKSKSEFDDSPIRCDLHPRWSFDGNYVSIDTLNDDIRSCYLYKINITNEK